MLLVNDEVDQFVYGQAGINADGVSILVNFDATGLLPFYLHWIPLSLNLQDKTCAHAPPSLCCPTCLPVSSQSIMPEPLRERLTNTILTGGGGSGKQIFNGSLSWQDRERERLR